MLRTGKLCDKHGGESRQMCCPNSVLFAMVYISWISWDNKNIYADNRDPMEGDTHSVFAVLTTNYLTTNIICGWAPVW